MLMDIAEASKHRHIESVRCILQYTPDIAKRLLEQTDIEYRGTALYWMCVNGELTVVSALLECGADPNTSNIYFHTPLHAAADMGFVNIAKLLLKYGAKTDTQNQNGQTALHLAAYRGYCETVEVLLKAGATHTIRNHRHLTPLQESTAMNHIHTSALLCTVDSSVSESHSNIPSGGRKVVLSRARSHSPQSLYTTSCSSATPETAVKEGHLYQQQRSNRNSLVSKRHRSEESVYLHSQRPGSVAPLPPARRQSTKTSIPSRRLIRQPTEHSDYSLCHSPAHDSLH